MQTKQQASLKGTFRYNGADLQVMKNVAITNDPHKAVEYFIEAAIKEGMTPNEYLEKVKNDINTILKT